MISSCFLILTENLLHCTFSSYLLKHALIPGNAYLINMLWQRLSLHEIMVSTKWCLCKIARKCLCFCNNYCVQLSENHLFALVVTETVPTNTNTIA